MRSDCTSLAEAQSRRGRKGWLKKDTLFSIDPWDTVGLMRTSLEYLITVFNIKSAGQGAYNFTRRGNLLDITCIYTYFVIMARTKKLTKEQLAKMSRECVSNNINRTARIITRLFDEESRKWGYLTTQVQTLYRIAYWEPVSINDLAQKADMDRTTALRNCRVLEKEGLITMREGIDRRYRMIELTDEGWNTVNRSHTIWHDQQAKIEKKIGRENMEKLVDMLRITGKMLKQ
jgi:DNA-binding MarR family transcriptional regulator